MVYAMVFGAHLLPYSWLYQSKEYLIFACVIPVIALILGNLYQPSVVAGGLTLLELVFVFVLKKELIDFNATVEEADSHKFFSKLSMDGSL